MTQVSIVIISKNENSLAESLVALKELETALSYEVVVVDASTSRMATLRARHPEVRWIDFNAEPVGRKTVTIPEQRNLGVAAAKADVIVFIDAGCTPVPGWLDRLVDPLFQGTEAVTVGSFHSERKSAYDATVFTNGYVYEAPTLNMAFTREAFDKAGGFDEAFSYCSDTDYCWRLNDAGIRIWMVADADIMVDWGGGRRQVRRAWLYGAGRARLYRKHPGRLSSLPRRDPVLVVYPLFLLGLPLAAVVPAYPLLLLVPLWRGRRSYPLRTIADHLAYGAGALAYLVGVAA